MRSYKFIAVVLMCISAVAVAQDKKAFSEKIQTKIDSMVNANMKASGIIGIGAAIIIDKKLLWTKGYGYVDLENNIPFTANTIMNMGSIAKPFTGVAMLNAVAEGKLSLDEDINKYLPFKVVNPNFPDAKITLRHLATHTSGITDRAPIYDSTYCYGSDPKVKLGDFLRDYFVPGRKFYAKDNFLAHRPGTYREYCNFAAALAGYIVERATGKPLNIYTKEKIFKPLRMENTGWYFSEVDMNQHTKLYDKRTDSLKRIQLYSGITYPDGGVRSSVSQLSKFFIALLNDGAYQGTRILEKELAQEMTRLIWTDEVHPGNVDPKKLNSGLFWATKKGGTLIGHAGTDPGVKTEMLATPDRRVGVILFTNTELTEKDLGKYYFGIYDELFRYANSLKTAQIPD